jgi:hypothetical protein
MKLWVRLFGSRAIIDNSLIIYAARAEAMTFDQELEEKVDCGQCGPQGRSRQDFGVSLMYLVLVRHYRPRGASGHLEDDKEMTR